MGNFASVPDDETVIINGAWLSGLDGSTECPWDRGDFYAPGDVGDIDLCDVARLLKDGWGAHEPSADELEADGAEWWADYNSMFEPYVADFPGLASAIDEDIDPMRLEVALGQYLSPARIGLVPQLAPRTCSPGSAGSVSPTEGGSSPRFGGAAILGRQVRGAPA